MRAFVLASLLLCSWSASAGTYQDKFTARADQVAISGVVELPLVQVQDGDLSPLVRVAVSDTRTALFRISLESERVKITKDLASELKLKVKSANKKAINIHGEDAKFKFNDEVNTTTLPKLGLGEATLTGVLVVVKDDLGDVGGFPVEGELGLAAFQDSLSWAIVSSQGRLRVGPASAGAQLVSAVGGQALSYKDAPSTLVRVKLRGLKSKEVLPAVHYIVPAAVAGAPIEAALGTGTLPCSLSPALAPSDAPTRPYGDQPRRWVSAQVAGLDLGGAWYRSDSGYDTPFSNPTPARAALCRDALYGLDIAVDPVNQRIALARNGRPEALDVGSDLLEAARKDTEAAPAPADGKDKKDAAAAGKPDSGPLRTLADLQRSQGDVEGAIATWKQVTALEPRACDAWQALGEAQLDGDHAADAVPSLQKAADLYHSWWDLDLEERNRISKQLKKLKTDAEKDAAAHLEAPSSCYKAEASLARALLATGDAAGAWKLYEDRMDLDPGLAVAATAAALAQGRWDAARGPAYQALEKATVGKPDAAPRLGLAVANAQDGNWTAAEVQFQGALNLDDLDLPATLAYMDAARAANGQAASLALAKSWADARPDSLAAQVAWLREAQLSGDADGQQQATARSEALISAPRIRRNDLSAWRATCARYYMLAGRVGDAERAARQALAVDPAQPLAWLVLADLAAAQGDASHADEYRARAVRLGAAHPAFALLAQKK